MALKTYVGARYAPRFMGAWDRANEYAALSVVYHDNQSYVSRKTVPAETEITNTGFWIRSSDWNAQVDEYRNQVDAYDEKVVQYNQNVEAYNAAANQFFDETIHAYNTKEDMVNDESVKVGYTLITCGETAIGDGGGSFYQVVEETSSGAVALKNGLFAKKFQLMPERFNRYTADSLANFIDFPAVRGDIIDNSNIFSATFSQVYLPDSKNKSTATMSKKLFGVIKTAMYINDVTDIENYNVNDYNYFLLKVNGGTYKRYKILDFMPISTNLNNDTPPDIYLLPNTVCANRLPANYSFLTRLHIARTTADYTINMDGCPFTWLKLSVGIGDKTATSDGITAVRAHPTPFTINIHYSAVSDTLSITTENAIGTTIGNCSYTEGSTGTTYADITGTFINHPFKITSSTTNLTLSLGYCGGVPTGLLLNGAFKNFILPVNNTTDSNKTINVKCVFAINDSVTEKTVNVTMPSGLSGFLVEPYYNVTPTASVFNVKLTQLW